jgi:hypothetical protein
MLKTTSIPCPITVQKSCYQNFAGCRCTVVAIDFPSNLHTNDLLLSIWYAESAAAFDPSQDRARIAKWYSNGKAATRTYLELHGLFRLLNTSPRAVCVTWLCSRSIIERVRYYHCAQYGRRTYGANMPHRQSLYHATGIAAAGVAKHYFHRW